MMQKLEFKKLREFGDIISDTFLFIKQNFKPLLKVYFYLCGFFILGGAIATIMQQLGVKDLLLGSPQANGVFGFNQLSRLFTFNYLLVFLFSLANYTAVNVTILSFIVVYIQKGNVAPTVEEVWTYFKFYFFRVFLSSIPLGVFLVACFVLCLIPGIYVFPAVALFYPVMILENSSFTKAFSRSFKLLKGYWWATAVSILIIWVITYAGMSFVLMPTILMSMIGTLTGKIGTWAEVLIVASAIIQHICYIFIILPIIASTFCYFNLLERRENAGLMGRIDQLGQTDQTFSSQEEY